MNYAKLVAENIDAASWYDMAELEIGLVCERESWCVQRFTSILALTSPRCSVRRNVRLALHYMRHGKHLHTILGVRRAIDRFETTGEIRGPKVSAFRRALLGDVDAIVLDVHMANLFGERQAVYSTSKGRVRSENLVKSTSKETGIPPRDVQACLWFGHRRSIGEHPKPFPIRHEYLNWLAYDRTFPDSGPIRQCADSQSYQPMLWRSAS